MSAKVVHSLRSMMDCSMGSVTKDVSRKKSEDGLDIEGYFALNLT